MARRIIRLAALMALAFVGNYSFSQTPESAELHIRFGRLSTDQAILVWGINGWTLPADTLWPQGTVVKDGRLESNLRDYRTESTIDLSLSIGDTLNWGIWASSGNGTKWFDQDPVYVGAARDTVYVTEQASLGSMVQEATVYVRKAWRKWLPFVALSIGLLALSLGLPFGRSDNARLPFLIPVFPHKVNRFLVALWVFAGIFVAGTAVFKLYYRSFGRKWDEGGWIKNVLVHFDLSTENVLAVWYSSGLLFVVGLLALGLGWSWSGKRKNLIRTAWTLLGLAFMALSADELGSIHERVLMLMSLLSDQGESNNWIVRLLGYGSLVAIVTPFGFLFWQRLRHSPRSLLLFVGGVLCLASIPIHEALEWASIARAPDPSTWLRPIGLLALEEGTEFVGTLLFLTSFGLVLTAQAEGGIIRIANDDFTRRMCWLVLAVLAIMGYGAVAGRIGFEYVFVLGDIGRLSQWFPSMASLLASVIAFGTAAVLRQRGDSRARVFQWLCVWALLLSAFHGSNFRFWGQTMGVQGLSGTAVAEILLVLTGLASLVQAMRYRTHRLVATGIVLASASIAMIAVQNPVVAVAADVIPGLMITAGCLWTLTMNEEPDSGQAAIP